MDLKTFYVTFGMGTMFRDYYVIIKAKDERIVRAFVQKHAPGLWSNVYAEPPKYGEKPLREKAEELYYADAAHV